MPEPTQRGAALSTILQLVVWSIVVGVALSALGITPFNFVERIGIILTRIYDLGFGALHWAFQYFLLGAIIVVPIWAIMRAMRGRGDRL
jgi:hypothetical protein